MECARCQCAYGTSRVWRLDAAAERDGCSALVIFTAVLDELEREKTLLAAKSGENVKQRTKHLVRCSNHVSAGFGKQIRLAQTRQRIQ